jgi:hypothetical protein
LPNFLPPPPEPPFGDLAIGPAFALPGLAAVEPAPTLGLAAAPAFPFGVARFGDAFAGFGDGCFGGDGACDADPDAGVGGFAADADPANWRPPAEVAGLAAARGAPPGLSRPPLVAHRGGVAKGSGGLGVSGLSPSRPWPPAASSLAGRGDPPAPPSVGRGDSANASGGSEGSPRFSATRPPADLRTDDGFFSWPGGVREAKP